MSDLSIFSGLFIFISSEWSIILLLITGLIAGAVLLYRSQKNLSTAEKEKTELKTGFKTELKTELNEKTLEKKTEMHWKKPNALEKTKK